MDCSGNVALAGQRAKGRRVLARIMPRRVTWRWTGFQRSRRRLRSCLAGATCSVAIGFGLWIGLTIVIYAPRTLFYNDILDQSARAYLGKYVCLL